MAYSNQILSARTEYILKLLNIKKTDKILNVGISNIPEIEIALENKVMECTTLDIDKKKLYNASGFLKKTNLVRSDITKKLPFKKNYFDKAVIIEVLEHLDDEHNAIKEIKRTLKKGGIIIAGVPNKNLLHYINPVKYIEHKRHYSNKEIVSLLQDNGFKIQDINIVEDWTLLANLYIHLFNKFILRRTRQFHIFKKSSAKTYKQHNKTGLDIIVKAIKV